MRLYLCHCLTLENLSHQFGAASPQPLGSRAGEMEVRGGFLDLLFPCHQSCLSVSHSLPWLLPKETLETYALEFIEGPSELSCNVLWESTWSVLLLTVSCVQT